MYHRVIPLPCRARTDTRSIGEEGVWCVCVCGGGGGGALLHHMTSVSAYD